MDEIVFEEENVWYFWDETWTIKHGPFETKEEAQKACEEYAEQL